ncbi:F-box protein [Senna tora]|uniref:F-box protein n=1 Tax=Senna tora TaxID=362788 RepID=A0A834X204_9FABA|nr:F-box protein [Senna tora]
MMSLSFLLLLLLLPPIISTILLLLLFKFLIKPPPQSPPPPPPATSLNDLPDLALASIVSFLPVDEAARTAVLSRRWNALWRCTTHLIVDQKRLFSSFFQLWLTATLWPEPTHHFQPHIQTQVFLLSEANRVAHLILHRLLPTHLGPVHSSHIVHLIESCRPDHVGKWVTFLLHNKSLKNLTLECERNPCWRVFHPPGAAAGWVRRQQPPELDRIPDMFSLLECLELRNYLVRRRRWEGFVGSTTLRRLRLKGVWIDEVVLGNMLSACVRVERVSVVGCKGFKRLRVESNSLRVLEIKAMKVQYIYVFASELKVLVFENMITRPRGLSVHAPNLKAFHCHCDPLIRGRTRLGFGRLLLTIGETVTIFRHLDLRNAGHYINGDNMFQNLETLCFGMGLNDATLYIEDRNEEYSLIPYYDLMFWEKGEACERWMSGSMRKVVIKGFEGRRVEVEFMQYLIAKAGMVESITIWFSDECEWGGASRAGESFVLFAERRRRASSASNNSANNLSLTLKPGHKYLREVGGTWEDWINYLNQKHNNLT